MELARARPGNFKLIISVTRLSSTTLHPAPPWDGLGLDISQEALGKPKEVRAKYLLSESVLLFLK